MTLGNTRELGVLASTTFRFGHLINSRIRYVAGERA
jgi:hypothetical protein